MKKEKSLKLNALLNLIRTLMGLIFPLISFPYSSRVLGPEGTGIVQYIQSFVSYFTMFAMLGIGTYGLRECAKVRDDKIALTKLSKEIFLINIVSTFISYCLFFLSIFIFKDLKQYKNILFVTSINIFFNTIGINWLFGAVEDYLYITIRSIIFPIFGLILLFVLVKDKNDIFEYAFLTVFTSVGSNVLNLFYSRKYINFFHKTKIEIKKHIKPIFILFGNVIAVNIYSVLDSIMLGKMSGVEQVGIYNAATKINRIVISLVKAIGSVITPRMSNYVENDKNSYDKLLITTCDIYCMFSIPCVVGLYFLAKPIINLFCGSEFEGSIIVMQIISLIIFFTSLGGFFMDQIFIPKRKDKYTLIAVTFGAISNLILNIIFIPKYQALGAAIATVISEFLVSFVSFILSIVLLKKKILMLFKNIWQYILATIIMLLLLSLISKLMIDHNYIYLFVSVISSISIYFIILIIVKNPIVLKLINCVKGKIKKS